MLRLAQVDLINQPTNVCDREKEKRVLQRRQALQGRGREKERNIEVKLKPQKLRRKTSLNKAKNSKVKRDRERYEVVEQKSS